METYNLKFNPGDWIISELARKPEARLITHYTKSGNGYSLNPDLTKDCPYFEASNKGLRLALPHEIKSKEFLIY